MRIHFHGSGGHITSGDLANPTLWVIMIMVLVGWIIYKCVFGKKED